VRAAAVALAAFAALASTTACSLWVDDQLTRDAAKLGFHGAEGEGEGAGEGEGGAGGEGEGEGATDPACEDNERLVIVTSDPTNPLLVYKLVPGGLVAVSPTGFTAPDGALVTEAGDSAANLAGATFDVATASFFLVDNTRYYAVDAHSLKQSDVRTPEKVVNAGFPSFHGVTATARYVIGAGNGLLGLDRQGAVASAPDALQSSDSFHGAITFSKDGVTYVAGNSEHGYQVLASSTADGTPTPSAGADDDTRFADFGGAQARRGLAFDAATGSLLLGNDKNVIVPLASSAFALPAASTDYVLPKGNFVDALAARSGKGYVADESGDFFEIDLSKSPPTTIEVSSWNPTQVSAIPEAIVVGCKRAVVALGGFGGPTIVSYDKDTLAPYGGGPEVHSIVGALIVNKTDLALTGDN
jgi:hypothetical protein